MEFPTDSNNTIAGALGAAVVTHQSDVQGNATLPAQNLKRVNVSNELDAFVSIVSQGTGFIMQFHARAQLGLENEGGA